jgi:hypothetical protein
MQSPAQQVWLATAIAALMLFAGFYACANADFRASDDNLWLYVAAHKLRSDAVATQEAGLIKALETAGYRGEGLDRMTMRQTYDRNYFAALALYPLGYAFVPIQSDHYATSLMLRVAAGFAASMGMVSLVLLLVVARLGNPRLAWATALGLAFCLIGLSGEGFYFILRPSDTLLPFLFHAVVDPGPQFSLFGFTPRSQFAIVMLAAFLLRWQAWHSGSYALLLLAMLFHQSHGGFMMAVLLGMDVLWRGWGLLREKRTLALIALMVALFCVRESLWRYIGWQAGAGLATAAGMLAIAALALQHYPTPGWLRRLRAWAGIHPVLADSSGLLAILLVLSILTGTAHLWAGQVAYTYFWGQLPSRFMAMVQPVLATALAHGVLHCAHGWQRPAFTGAIVLAVMVRLACWPWHDAPMAEAMATTRDYAARLAAMPPYSASQQPQIYHEPVWYYALARAADGLPSGGLGALFTSPPRSSSDPVP